MINQDPGVVTIQSQLVFGHAGNSAAVFPLEYAGIPVCAVPTVLFSNNPHYPSMAGEAIDPARVRALLKALLERQPPSCTRAVISGFLGGAGVVEPIAAFVDEVKAGNTACPYVLDPVLGSRDVGDIADHETFLGIRDVLLPRADIVIPNDYELERLTGLFAGTPDAAKEAAGLLIERGVEEVAVTGIGASDAATLDCIVVTRAGAWRVETPRLPVRPVGTGDLLTALYTAARLQGSPPVDALSHSVSGTFAIVEEGRTRGLYELPLAQLGAALYRPGRYFRAMEFR